MATEGPVCVSVINMKGGVGKTTIAALLGRYASLHLKLNVLAIDLDPQANLSQAFMRDRNYKEFLQGLIFPITWLGRLSQTRRF